MKISCRFFLAFLLMLSVTVVQAGRPRIEFTEYTLNNGLHVILHQDNTTPNVVINIMYHVGSKNENPERTGFAHFFEHLMFEGTEHIGRHQFTAIVEESGGSLNAWTSFDITNYYVFLPANQLELGLWLESERMLHPVIDSIGIATQKSVVTEEMKQTRDNRPYGRLLTETLQRAFTQHSYRWDVLGADPHIRNATDEEIKEFHSRFYVPDNAVLVITGDFDLNQTKNLVEKYFGDIPRGQMEIYRPLPNEPRRTTEIRDTVYDDIQIPAVIQAYMIPAQGTPDFYAMELLGNLLSQGQSSRLYRRLVDQEQKSLQVMAIALGLEHPGLNLVFALTNMGVDPKDVENIINEEIEMVRNELITEIELQKLKNQIESQMINDNTTIARRASNLANYHLLYGEADLINTELERYMKVTREDIQRVAREYLSPDNRVVLYFLPREAK
jgi:zinc protease